MNGNKPILAARPFTSVLIALAFGALVLSGAILFLSPPGRVANWSDWRMLRLTKHDWSGLHVWFGVVFLGAAIFHVIFNFRPLANYFKDRLTRRVGFRREWVVAVGLCGVVFAGTRTGVPPFSTFLAFNERIKKSWEDSRSAAPIPHAELLPLKELAGKAEVPWETALQRLADKNVKGATPEIVVAELAFQNDLSARRIYEILQGVPTRGWGGGGGPGRMTLTEFCESRNIDVKEAQERLEAGGIKLTPGQGLRDIALDNGYERPTEIMEIIEGRSK